MRRYSYLCITYNAAACFELAAGCTVVSRFHADLFLNARPWQLKRVWCPKPFLAVKGAR